MAIKRSVFRSSALISGLVTPEQLDEAEQAVRTSVQVMPGVIVVPDDQQIAAHLVQTGVLTAYQADQLCSGRTKLNLGPYVVTEWIAQGGMGMVFKGVHKFMGRTVALKVLPLSKSTPDAIANFMREIRTQAKLDHPNLVRVSDAGHDGNVHFMVAEFVPGCDLRRLVRSHGRLNMGQAATVIVQAAKALDYAHSKGLVHRDVKPGNLLVDPDGVTKVSDLGLAGFIDQADADPRAGKIVGTADFLAPETVRNPRAVEPVSDIYSLGCTLYYAVTGKVPFPGGTLNEKFRRLLNDGPRHPRSLNPELSEEFIDVLGEMMAKEPEHRLRTMKEVISRLEPFVPEKVTMPDGTGKSPWSGGFVPMPGFDSQAELPDTDGSFYDEVQPPAPGEALEHTVPISAGTQPTLQQTLPPNSPPADSHPVPPVINPVIAPARGHSGVPAPPKIQPKQVTIAPPPVLTDSPLYDSRQFVSRHSASHSAHAHPTDEKKSLPLWMVFAIFVPASIVVGVVVTLIVQLFS